MHCCQTALEIDLGKHLVIYLTSALTIWSIDLPELNMNLSEALECVCLTHLLLRFVLELQMFATPLVALLHCRSPGGLSGLSVLMWPHWAVICH